MILNDFFKALGQMGDPKFLRVFFLGVGSTIAILFVFYLIFLGLLQWIFPDSMTIPWIGEVRWIDDAISWASIPLMLILSVFLMVPVASAVTGFFLESVAQAVEDKHYPSLPPAIQFGFMETLQDSAAFLGVIVVANLFALILYIFLAPFALFIFWGLNGYLLGREYFQMVAMRRVGRDAAISLRKKYMLRIWIAGILMTAPLTIPLISLIVPILGVATFTHLYHRIQATTSGRTNPDPAR
ncbi:EI24 domain-containing protein [Parasulfitobacter algicola]|uniref:EI24 domain-containing protein n=1 Tax=Parasulfitobacter algicola TaxID=2614809 RepID=A0ABX2IT33_9RHOB|nr:EI24 domain-containing protein [Sulfitobacter algicola]NSX56057.1 EI24 domain-containing protein [Sulfitobacter algicola]